MTAKTRKAGRPRKDAASSFSAGITVRFTPEQLAALDAERRRRSDLAGVPVTLAGLIRALALEALARG